MSNYQETEALYTSGIYVKRNLTIVRGKGALLYDENGTEYIDCVGGQGSANLGHAHPKIVAAISAQAEKLITCNEIFYNDQRAQYLEKLIQAAPAGMKKAFLCSSGTEAMEAAIKFARFSSKRKRFIATVRGFHGRSMGSLSATWEKKYREPFEPLLEGFTHVPYNNLQKLDDAINEDTAAVIVEVVQGEGGVNPGSAEFLCGAERLCHERGALLIVDEVQTGFGRTGKLFALSHYNLNADLICVAKSIAGGLPMGATLIGERVAELTPGIHGTTFGGNPLTCAAALAALQVMEEEHLPERAAKNGKYMLESLQKIDSPIVREMRGLGLMIGIEIKHKVAPYLQALMAEGVLALPAGMNVLRLLPPLVIEPEQIDRAVAAIQKVLTTNLATGEGKRD